MYNTYIFIYHYYYLYHILFYHYYYIVNDYSLFSSESSFLFVAGNGFFLSSLLHAFNSKSFYTFLDFFSSGIVFSFSFLHAYIIIIIIYIYIIYVLLSTILLLFLYVYDDFTNIIYIILKPTSLISESLVYFSSSALFSSLPFLPILCPFHSQYFLRIVLYLTPPANMA